MAAPALCLLHGCKVTAARVCAGLRCSWLKSSPARVLTILVYGAFRVSDPRVIYLARQKTAKQKTSKTHGLEKLLLILCQQKMGSVSPNSENYYMFKILMA